MPNLVSWNTVTALWIAWLAFWFLSALGVRRNERGESVGQMPPHCLGAGGGRLSDFRTLDSPCTAERALCSRQQRHPGRGARNDRGGSRHHDLGPVPHRAVLERPGDAQGRPSTDSNRPYARVRHPIYSGVFLALLGTALFAGEWRAPLGALIVLVAHWLKARREEDLLAGQFGEAYAEYCQRTGALVPRWR